MPPPNLDVPIWRYMDFTKFVSLLQNRGLFFPTVTQLNDPFEGSFARGNLQELQKQVEPTPAPSVSIWKKLELPALVERVYVAPDTPDWFFALASEVTKQYGTGSIPVVKSSLANAPLY